MVSVEGGMSFTADIININEMENTMRTDITKINEKSPDRKSTRLNSSHTAESRMPSSA